MSSTSNNPYLVKSMNGAITIDDGAGTVIQNGTITSTNVDNTNAPVAIGSSYGVTLGSATAYARTLYTAVLPTDIVNLSCLNTFSIDLLNKANTWSLKNTFTSGIATNLIEAITSTASLIIGSNLTSAGSIVIGAITGLINRIGSLRIVGNTLDTFFTGNVLNLGTGRASQIILGSSTIPPRTPYVALSGNDIVNYSTMLTFTSSGVLAGANNIFTGTYNQFNNYVYAPNIQTIPEATGNMFIGTSTSGTINIGTTIATTPTSMILGNSTCSVGIRTLNNLVIGPNVTPSSTTPVSYVGPCLEITNTTTNSIIDFHSSANLNDFDGRIICQGGTAGSSATGAMTLQAGTINVNPVGNVFIGSTTSTNTFIRNTDGLIIGNDPTTYNPATGLMSAPGMRFGNGGSNSFIDFHSNTVGSINYDARIICSGGSASTNNGTLGLESGNITLSATANTTVTSTNSTTIAGTGININAGTTGLNINSGTGGININTGSGNLNYTAGSNNFSGNVRANSGIGFPKGVFGSGMMMTAGGTAINRNLGADSATTENISFGMTFGGGAVYITIAGYSTVSASMGVVTNFFNTTSTGFTATFYNSRSVTASANTYGLNWVAYGYV